MKKNHSVAIVGAHPIFAAMLSTFIETFDKFNVLYSVENAENFIGTLKSETSFPDVVLLDACASDSHGLATMNILTAKYPQLKVLVFTVDYDEGIMTQLITAGARGCLTRDIGLAVLHTSLKEVVENGFYYSDKIRSILLNSLQKKEQCHVPLKEREIEFLRQVCTEKTYKEIASEMFLSPKTIDGYREALFEKLRIKSRVGLALYAIKNKLYKVE